MFQKFLFIFGLNFLILRSFAIFETFHAKGALRQASLLSDLELKPNNFTFKTINFRSKKLTFGNQRLIMRLAPHSAPLFCILPLLDSSLGPVPTIVAYFRPLFAWLVL